MGSKKSKISCKAVVDKNVAISPKFYKLSLIVDDSGSEFYRNLTPGRFAQFDVTRIPLPLDEHIPQEIQDASRRNLLLRRPLSFAGQREENGNVVLDALFCVLGPATVRMTTLKPGDEVDMIGPLGNGFWVPDGKKTALLIAGGMGAPPLQHMAAWLSANYPDIQTVAFAGARSFEHLPYFNINDTGPRSYIEEFACHGVQSCVATDDGSFGQKGFVTDLVNDWLDENGPNADEIIIYACGPEPMLHAAARLAEKTGIDCQVSLERRMACGIGLCQSCAVEVKSNADEKVYKLCCKDGPVFDSREVVFE